MRIFGLATFAGLGLIPVLVSAATFVVDSATDSGTGSLREAIVAANSNTGPDTINFNIPSGNILLIVLASPLPALTDPVTIDGTTQSGTVTVVGSQLNAGDGFAIRTNNCLIRGLAIGGFANGSAIAINGGNNNTIESCLLGAEGTATNALPNSNGVQIFAGDNNLIGTDNLIVNNAADGVSILSGTGNAVLGNAIFDNAGLGINLSTDAITPNDLGDADTGPNNFQNFPILDLAGVASATTISGSLNSRPNRAYRLEFFASPQCTRQGQVFLGAGTVATDASGNGTFNLTVTTPVTVGAAITATATDPAGNTSEFSDCVIADVLPCAQDITDLVEVRPGKVFRNARTGRFFQRVTIRNTSTATFQATPLKLAVLFLTPQVSVLNATEVTSCTQPPGSPVLFVTNKLLKPRKSASVRVEYDSHTNRCITFTPLVLAGAGTP